MATVGQQLLKLFGIKRTQTAPRPHVRTLSSPQIWNDLIEAFNGYGGGASLQSLKVSTVFACDDRISKDMACLPVRPVRETVNGFEIDKEHTVYKLLSNPSPFFTYYTWRKVMESHTNRYGDGFSVIRRKNGVPFMLEIWYPGEVEHRIEGGKLYWKNSRLNDVVNDDDMIHFMWFTDDGIRGKSLLKFATELIDIARNGGKLAKTLYENGLWQPFYLSYKDELTQEQHEVLSQNLSGFTGEAQKDNILVVDRGSELKGLGMTMKDSEYSLTIENAEKAICRMFGLRPSIVGFDGSNVSYNSREQDQLAYTIDTLLPRCVGSEQEFERKLLMSSEVGVIRIKHELKSRLRGDMAARSSFYQTALTNGLLSINDILRLEDMNTIGPEGDERYIQGAMVPLSKLFSGELSKDNTNQADNTDTQKLFADWIKSLSKNGNGHAITARELS